jgi:hypothetical protein
MRKKGFMNLDYLRNRKQRLRRWVEIDGKTGKHISWNVAVEQFGRFSVLCSKAWVIVNRRTRATLLDKERLAGRLRERVPLGLELR